MSNTHEHRSGIEPQPICDNASGRSGLLCNLWPTKILLSPFLDKYSNKNPLPKQGVDYIGKKLHKLRFWIRTPHCLKQDLLELIRVELLPGDINKMLIDVLRSSRVGLP